MSLKNVVSTTLTALQEITYAVPKFKGFYGDVILCNRNTVAIMVQVYISGIIEESLRLEPAGTRGNVARVAVELTEFQEVKVALDFGNTGLSLNIMGDER